MSSVFTDMMMASMAATGATILVHPVDMAKVSYITIGKQ